MAGLQGPVRSSGPSVSDPRLSTVTSATVKADATGRHRDCNIRGWLPLPAYYHHMLLSDTKGDTTEELLHTQGFCPGRARERSTGQSQQPLHVIKVMHAEVGFLPLLRVAGLLPTALRIHEDL